MSVPDWPVTLTQTLLVDGFEGSSPDLLLRSSMDAGPAKVRRRATAGARPVTGKLLLTAAELSTFKTFYDETLLSGSLRFNWLDPDDGVTAVEMRFTERPSWVSLEPDEFEVSMNLEIMP